MRRLILSCICALNIRLQPVARWFSLAYTINYSCVRATNSSPTTAQSCNISSTDLKVTTSFSFQCPARKGISALSKISNYSSKYVTRCYIMKTIKSDCVFIIIILYVWYSACKIRVQSRKMF